MDFHNVTRSRATCARTCMQESKRGRGIFQNQRATTVLSGRCCLPSVRPLNIKNKYSVNCAEQLLAESSGRTDEVSIGRLSWLPQGVCIAFWRCAYTKLLWGHLLSRLSMILTSKSLLQGMRIDCPETDLDMCQLFVWNAGLFPMTFEI
jgi:hypothetical protein